MHHILHHLGAGLRVFEWVEGERLGLVLVHMEHNVALCAASGGESADGGFLDQHRLRCDKVNVKDSYHVLVVTI